MYTPPQSNQAYPLVLLYSINDMGYPGCVNTIYRGIGK